MAKKIRKQTYSLGQYLKAMEKEVIRTDQDCQRLSGQWNANMVNELLYTVLTDGYIPPIILGEETSSGITRSWIIDGLQRSSSLALFRYGNKAITRKLDEYMVPYQRKALDESGNVKRDTEGEILWETAECDIRGKTYGKLPEELQDMFNEYQLETAIHQDCDITQISKLVRKYNNHQAMNTNQKAFTYADNFAADIRKIAQNRFFLDVYSCTGRGKINGTIEWVVMDTVILCNYPENFKKDAQKGFEWLNENATLQDFETVDNLLTRMTLLNVTPGARELFNPKHAHIFVSVFKAFLEIGKSDGDFEKFIEWFVNGGNDTEVDGKSWNSINEKYKSTRDTNVVREKLNFLVSLMNQYFEKDRIAA